MQAQRAGVEPPDGVTTFSSVWSWKSEAFTTICPTYFERLSPAERRALHLEHYAGYFQNGSALRFSSVQDIR